MRRCASVVKRGGLLAGAAGILLVAGCARTVATPPVHPVRTPPPPTATVSVAFAVDVTPRPTPRPKPARPRPTPTSFVAPSGPYLRLSPSSGPPVNETIRVRGGNFPSNATVTLTWIYGPRASSLSTTARAGGNGRLAASFQIPATPPGKYRLSASVAGVPYATALYFVKSTARLTASIVPNSGGDGVTVRGAGFVPRVKLLLVAYSVFTKRKPITIGTIQASARGAFVFHTTTRTLVPGEYALRAWTVDSLVAEVGSTFFLVVA